MKIKPLIITCLAGLLLNIVISQNTVAQTANQIKKMRAVGIPVVLPSYIPTGYKLTSFKIINYSYDDLYKGSYKAIYKGKNSCEISALGGDGGFGGGGSIRQWIVKTELFGRVILEESGDYKGQNFLNVLIIPPSRNREFIHFPKAGYEFEFQCKYSTFSYKTAIKILKSLRVVK
jgi:hypothetical protein